jgi:hypothetical protein
LVEIPVETAQQLDIPGHLNLRSKEGHMLDMLGDVVSGILANDLATDIYTQVLKLLFLF